MKILSPDGAPILDPAAWLGAAWIFATAYLVGAAACHAMRNLARLDAHLIRICVGLAILPALAVCGLTPALPWLLGTVLILISVGVAFFLHRRTPAPSPVSETTLSSLSRYCWLLPLAAWAFLLPPAFSPPMNYDVLEYHLGVVPHWFREGAIKPIPHIFYSAQPLATESLYFLAALQEGTPWGRASGLVQWLLIGLTLLLLSRVLHAVRCPSAWIAPLVLLFLVHPVILPLALDRMTDLTGATFMLAGLLVIFTSAADSSQFVRNLVIGLFIGAAVASKWTNAGTSAQTLFLAALAGEWIRPISFARFARSLTAIALGTLLTLGPWLIWNFVHNGNPFAPFLASWFSADAWSAGQLDFLIQQHEPLSPANPRYWLNLYRRLASFQLGPPILLGTFMLAAMARMWPRRFSSHLGIAIGIVFACLLWGRLGQASTRFLAPVFAASILLLGAVAGRVWPVISHRAKVSATTILALTLLVYASLNPGLRNLPTYWSVALGRTPPRDLLDATRHFWDAVNTLPETAHPVAIGEARTFYFTRPVAVASVFDEHPIRKAVESAQLPGEIAIDLMKQGYTHLVVNEYELARLLQFHPALELMNDPRFQKLRANGQPAWPQLLAAYPGWAEFASNPLTPDERANYALFLRNMKNQSQWIEPRGGALTFWIAPLSPPTSPR